MSDHLARRMAAAELAAELAQLQRRTASLADAYALFNIRVAAGQSALNDEARRLAADALDIALQAERVEAGRRAAVYLDDPNTPEV